MACTSRVFMGFLDICGLYWALESGLREAGAHVYFLDLGEDTLGYRKNQSRRLIPDFFRRSYKSYTAVKDGRRLSSAYIFRSARLSCAMALLVGWMVLCFDIFVIKSGQSIAGGTALFRLLRLLGKTIIFTYHGSDSRPPYLIGVNAFPDAELAALTRMRKRHLEKVSPFADYIIDNPVSAHFQTRRCGIYQCFFNSSLPPDAAAPDRGRPTGEGALRVLHAPSFPELKGSGIVRATIRELESEGHSIEYTELVGVTNAEVLAAIARCDLVVDELYSDIYGAVFALEAAAQGKPVLVCGYARSELDRFVPAEARLPTHYCPPEELEAALRRLLEDANYRRELGERARRFASGWASPKAAAERLLVLARGEAPDEWFFEPSDIRYIHGVGGSEEKIRHQVRRLIDFAGPGALLLDDKTDLRGMLVEFSTTTCSERTAASLVCQPKRGCGSADRRGIQDGAHDPHL